MCRLGWLVMLNVPLVSKDVYIRHWIGAILTLILKMFPWFLMNSWLEHENLYRWIPTVQKVAIRPIESAMILWSIHATSPIYPVNPPNLNLLGDIRGNLALQIRLPYQWSVRGNQNTRRKATWTQRKCGKYVQSSKVWIEPWSLSFCSISAKYCATLLSFP